MQMDDQIRDFSPSDALSHDSLQVLLVLGKLAETLAAAGEPIRINTLFSDLVERVDSHFSLEERLMDSHGYPGRHWHRLVHRELLNEMRVAQAQANAGRTAIDRAILRRVRALFSPDEDEDDVFRGRAKMDLFKEVLRALHPADLAEALSEFDLDQRAGIFGGLKTDQASGTLEEVGPQLQRELVASLSIERVAELIDFMTPAQAASVLRNLTPAESWAILHQLGAVRSRKITALMEKRESESLRHLATLRYMRAGPDMSCGDLLGSYRSMAASARVWRYIYVISAEGSLLGAVDMRDALMAEPQTRLSQVMMTNWVALRETDSVDEAAAQLENYGFDALPVIDAEGLLIGVLVARDVMTVGEW